jgi:outer membrane protein TolC
MPIVLARPASTSPPGTLGIGAFGGGSSGNYDFGSRVDYDFQLIWELQNLGFGNRAKIRQRRSENEVAVLELLRAQDQVGADVTQAYAAVNSARERLDVAIPAYIEAKRNLEKNIEGLPQTKRVNNLLVLIIRPQEVVAAFQAMSQAIVDYHSSLADFNRAQFRLNRALGNSVAPVLDELMK